jgi:hypothetical protein
MIQKTIRVVIRNVEQPQTFPTVAAAKQFVEDDHCGDKNSNPYFAEVEVATDDMTPPSSPNVDTQRPRHFERHVFEPEKLTWRRVQ